MRGENQTTIYLHRERAVRLHARAMAAMRRPNSLNWRRSVGSVLMIALGSGWATSRP